MGGHINPCYCLLIYWLFILLPLFECQVDSPFYSIIEVIAIIVIIVSDIFVATVVPDDDHVPWSQESYEEPRDVSVLWLSVSVQCPMPTRAFGRPGLVEALGFKCIICNAEYVTRRGADCHRRHPACSGTACADPSNMQSVSLTARSDVSVGLLRQHSAAPLGTCVILHSK